ncbi:C40 family peptidase [Alkalitalea saponilacus]|uniref:SH3 domain-containing protein n=1 Tax=Alkalitalea saponilacus TaxID=889453 RepID=A0A1T5F792_9BACT|nr:C40 family peptidase [Alkalitalea saponilacus]ASB50151.1 glycoside hydrolase [Alkalitalea saponilacus]SKB92047.1 SH3 domain-containing protein [Alkalitalea saponilacus]
MRGSISPYSVLSVRREPSEKSELETQLLFGEVFYVDEIMNGWVKIKTEFDGYEGWIDERMYYPVRDKEIELWLSAPGVIIPTPMFKLIREPEKSAQLISAGSRIVFNGEDRNSFVIGHKEFYCQSTVPDRTPDLEEIAKGFLNTSYLWGGRNIFGIDCSGLSQVVFKIMGKRLPRNASQQIEHGAMVSFVEEARAGDLAFFDNPEGEITHVGICLGQGRILHASGEVRLDHLDHQGIFNRELQKYTHHLRVIKRMME